MPCVMWVNLRDIGTRNFSLREVTRRMVVIRKKEREPDGKRKEPMFRFMYVACSTEKVVIWE